jgi:D-beta-D-heptose 7-phosphate kinase/D-beta-D-heptose 1-phosphate adenosyltransferase
MNIDYLHIIDQFNLKRVLVIGDLILDVYLKGTSTRLSPEAPVPVVDIAEKQEWLGGAANTATNLRALGAQVTLLSVVGNDDDGIRAIKLVQEASINSSKIIRHASRKTIVKTRVMVGSHVLTRYDYGTETEVESSLEQILIRCLKVEYGQYDAIVISDYNKGLITPALLQVLITLRERFSVFVAVDSKRLSFFKPLRPSVAKPNYDEVQKLLGIAKLTGPSRIEQIQSLGSAIFDATQASITAVTLDEDGSLIFLDDAYSYRACTQTVSSPQVAGAGDTFISTLTLALISGADVKAASHLACAAASIAIRKDGTACCRQQELRNCFSMNEKEIHSLSDLTDLCDRYRSRGKRIVFTNGCFDILHSGHVSYLNRARQLGDVLIVGINNDESIRRLKGPSRPINTLPDRVQVLSGLSAVSHIISFGDEKDDTPISLIEAVKPDVFVKGGDYTRERLPEASTVEKVGGDIVFLSLVPDHSTSLIIEQIHKSSLAVA